MPKIPLYEQRVAPTTQIGGAEARGADLPYKALAGVGDTIAQIGFKGAEMAQEYQERKQKLKADSDLSDYEVTRTQFEAELEQKKNDAMMSGTSYQDVYDNVVVPSLQQFGQEIEGRNYSEESLAKIGQRWGIDSAKIAKSAIMERDILQQRRNRMIEAQQLRSEAAMTKYGGQMQKRAGTLGAFSTILGGAGKIGLASMGGGGGTGASGGKIAGDTSTYGMFNPQMNTIASYR